MKGTFFKPAKGKKMHTRRPVRKVSSRQRADLAYAAKVRAQVAKRDEMCRVGALMSRTHLQPCDGPLQWCHMQGKRRGQTRLQPPPMRHSTAWTLMLCRFHSDLEERRLLTYRYLSDHGADGPMVWTLPSGDQMVEAA